MGLTFSRSLVSHSRRRLPATTLTTPPLLRRRPLPAPPLSPLLLSSSRRLFTTNLLPRRYISLDLERDPNNRCGPASSTAEMAMYSAFDTEDVLYLRVNMPGVSRDGVEVCLEPPHKLTVKGYRQADPDLGEIGVVYGYAFSVPSEYFVTEQIKHVMKDGMLVVSIQKVVRGDVAYSDQSFTINNPA